jgi:putative transposase
VAYGFAVVNWETRRDGVPWRTRTRAILSIGIARGEGFSLIAAGGTANHVHLLFVLPASYSLAHVVQKLKGSSSRWMGHGFSWQEGYGAFSVSPSQVEVLKGYIQNQEEHHHKRNFEQEFVILLSNCGIVYDEHYVFG